MGSVTVTPQIQGLSSLFTASYILSNSTEILNTFSQSIPNSPTTLHGPTNAQGVIILAPGTAAINVLSTVTNAIAMEGSPSQYVQAILTFSSLGPVINIESQSASPAVCTFLFF